MNVSKYKALLLAVDRGSFSKATEEMGYTQSGMTHMMNSLEEEIGFRVIERGYYGIRLTEKGEKLMPAVRRMVRQTELLEEEIERLRRAEKKSVSIGICAGMATEPFLQIVEIIRRRTPDLKIEMYTEGTAALYEGLLSGRYDVIFAVRMEKYAVEFLDLAREKTVVLLPASEGDAPFSLAALHGRDFLVSDGGFQAEALELLKAEGIRPTLLSTFVEPAALTAMVARGLGVTVLPASLLESGRGDVLSHPLPDAYTCHLGVAFSPHTEKTEGCEAVLSAAREWKEKEAALSV